jgi:hypothetical protein
MKIPNHDIFMRDNDIKFKTPYSEIIRRINGSKDIIKLCNTMINDYTNTHNIPKYNIIRIMNLCFYADPNYSYFCVNRYFDKPKDSKDYENFDISSLSYIELVYIRLRDEAYNLLKSEYNILKSEYNISNVEN